MFSRLPNSTAGTLLTAVETYPITVTRKSSFGFSGLGVGECERSGGGVAARSESRVVSSVGVGGADGPSDS